jgi:hypothetical protein
MKPHNLRPTRKTRLTGFFAFFAFCAPIFFTLSASAARLPSNRWLFIVETSRAMQPRSEAAAQIAGNLILSGMSGQMHPGDTIGVWTFGSDLRTGEFPLQTWTSNNVKQIAENLSLFLATRTFEKTSRLDKVVPTMNALAAKSEFITIILISSGSEKIRGTPFDAKINPVYQKFQSQQETARLPFVTVLRGQLGKLVDFKVTAPPASVEFPPLPPELLITNTPVAMSEVKTTPPPPPPPPVAPPLIIHGKKPAPEIIPTPPAIVKTNEPVVTNKTLVAEIKTNAQMTNVPAIAAAPRVAGMTSSVPASNEVATNTAAISAKDIVALAGPERTSDKKFFIAGAATVAAGIGLLLILLRRSRAQTHVSLITRSLDRDKE